MSYVDLDSIHVPAAGTRPPAGWGLQVNDNFDYIHDEIIAKMGAWTSYTPTLTQSGSVTKTVNYAKYNKIGRRVIGATHMTCSSTGTAGNSITVGLPVTAASFTGTPIIGTFWVYDITATTGYLGALIMVSTTTAVGWGSGYSGNIGSTPNFGLATNDQVGFSFAYEAAS